MGCQPPEEPVSIAGTWQVGRYTVSPAGDCGGAPSVVSDPGSCALCAIPAPTFVMGPQQINGQTYQIIYPCEDAESCASVDPGASEILGRAQTIALDTPTEEGWQVIERTAGVEASSAYGASALACRYREVVYSLTVDEEVTAAVLTRTERSFDVALSAETLTNQDVVVCLNYAEAPPDDELIACGRVERIEAALVMEEEE